MKRYTQEEILEMLKGEHERARGCFEKYRACGTDFLTYYYFGMAVKVESIAQMFGVAQEELGRPVLELMLEGPVSEEGKGAER